MCGFIITNKKINIKKNLKTLNHRGPHSSSSIILKNIKMIFNILSIIDINKRSNQPMLYRNLTMCYNGEIYNYEEIKKKLENIGFTFDTTSDSEVLLKCFYKYREKTLEMLEGMFAFAIYDSKNNSLFVARDAFGIKPLFFNFSKKSFFISSEKKSFFKNGFAKTINFNSIIDYLRYGTYQHLGNTFFKEISSLIPGHYFIIKNNKIKFKKWFNIKKVKIYDYHKSKSQLKKLIIKSLNFCLLGDRKITISCSGGVDSSILAELSLKTKNKNLKHMIHYTCNDVNDETKFALEVNKKLNLKFMRSIFYKKDFFLYLKKSILAMNEPVGGLNNLSALKAYKYLKKKKINVLIDGNGSDEILGGYSHYLNSYFYKKKYKVPPIHGEEFFFNKSIYHNKILNNLYFKKKKREKKFKDKNDYVNFLINQDLMGSKLRRTLLQGDHLSMHYSIETRYPFLNKELVNFSRSLPNKFLFKSNKGKFILRDILKNKNVEIKKRILQTPQNIWMDEFIKKKTIAKLKKKERIYKYKIFDKNNLINFLQNQDCKKNSVLEWRIINLIYFFKLLPKF
jgi:asparagine synthase (glutamine-hydrolysing)